MTPSRESLSRGGAGSEAPPSRAVLDACRDAGDSRELRAALRPALSAWVPFDAYCVNTCDPTTLVVTSSVGDGLSPAAALRLFAIESEGTDLNLLADLARARTRVVTMATSTGGSVARSRRMREPFLPLGLRDELRAPLFAGGLCWGYLHLFRTRQPFSARDVARVASAAVEVGRALRRLTAAGPASAEPAAPHPPGLVVLEPDGRARTAAGFASALLRPLDLDGHQPVPHGVYAVAERARRGHAGDAVGTVRSPAGGWLSLHGIEDAATRAATAIVDAAPPSRLTPLLFLAWGLSRREREVADRILAGCSNADIANDLSIQVFTVKDHVKRIFAKSRSSGRAHLTARVHGRS